MVENTKEKESKTQTLIVAYRTKEGDVILASDTLLSLGDVVKIENAHKIVEKEGILVGCAGYLHFFQLFEDKIGEIAKEIKKEESIINIKFKLMGGYKEIKERYLELFEEEANSEEARAEAILVFPYKNEIKILRMVDGKIEEYTNGLVAVGFPTVPHFLLGYAFRVYKLNRPLKKGEALPIIYQIFKTVEENSNAVGGIDVWIYTKNGKIKHLKEEQLEKINNKFEEKRGFGIRKALAEEKDGFDILVYTKDGKIEHLTSNKFKERRGFSIREEKRKEKSFT